jgi:hypothetical protein
VTHLDTEVLARGVTALHAAHTAGTWHPPPGEATAVDHLARGQRNAALFDAVLREAPGSSAGAWCACWRWRPPSSRTRSPLTGPRRLRRWCGLRQLVDALPHGDAGT